MLLALALVTALHADSLPSTLQITGDIMGNPLKELCTLKQTGTTLTGKCTNEAGGPWDVTGEVKDGKFTFKHGGDYQGQALTMEYTGTLVAPTTLKGSVVVQPFGAEGSFTAAPPAPSKP